MMVYRFASEQYKDDISGNGAALYGGRWNSKGNAVLYTSSHISRSVLELLVHYSQFLTLRNPFLIAICIPENTKPRRIDLADLPDDWHKHPSYTRKIGDRFISENDALVLQVPSSIIPQENNFLINPLHASFEKISIADSGLFELDKRLVSH